VLLLIAFRPVGISLVSIGLNLLSVGAACGLITLIFQDGRLRHLLGYTLVRRDHLWVPLFLFGISMDYDVFILSRLRELWPRASTPRATVVSAIASWPLLGDRAKRLSMIAKDFTPENGVRSFTIMLPRRRARPQRGCGGTGRSGRTGPC
jgi:hypothetical protein